jgi:hypothetical protein
MKFTLTVTTTTHPNWPGQEVEIRPDQLGYADREELRAFLQREIEALDKADDREEIEASCRWDDRIAQMLGC